MASDIMLARNQSNRFPVQTHLFIRTKLNGSRVLTGHMRPTIGVQHTTAVQFVHLSMGLTESRDEQSALHPCQIDPIPSHPHALTLTATSEAAAEVEKPQPKKGAAQPQLELPAPLSWRKFLPPIGNSSFPFLGLATRTGGFDVQFDLLVPSSFPFRPLPLEASPPT
ncbi:hypothetical protein FRC20_005332 [Serendipita sp. 405]|nr:hypothetical protein FRC20_005332 [Serendipita sp. 405]